ncbi:SDR family oxidoreductase [Deltaproteobacteria bacterium]|nr:SDR family oxidoreductase [Deltaproteobacteria bacterium]
MENIVKERNDKRCLFLVTGASGFLGSHLAMELAKKGYWVVVLVRRLNGISAVDRFRRIAEWLEIDPETSSHIRVIEGDMCLAEFGIGKELYKELLDSVTEIINCAADTSFMEKRRDLVERINLYGLKSLLDMAAKGNCVFFHQVSTAYVSGNVSGICEEKLACPDSFMNVYEETKCKAEHLAARACEEAGIGLNIYRPGIVCGESSKGRTFRFNALYYPLKSIYRLISTYKKDLNENGGGMAKKVGVRVDSDNRLVFPLKIMVKENAGINIIPVDFFTSMFVEIMENCTEGGIFHIVQEKNSSIKSLIEFTKEYFFLKGLDVTHNEKTEGPIERIFNLYNEPYLPYFLDDRTFSYDNTRPLKKKNRFDDCFTYERFKICMDYAIKTDWGKKLLI